MTTRYYITNPNKFVDTLYCEKHNMAFNIRCTDCWREDKADPTTVFINGVEQ